MAADKDMSDLMREIAGEFGVAFDKRRTAVIDHFIYEPSLDRRCVSLRCLFPTTSRLTIQPYIPPQHQTVGSTPPW